MTLLGTLRKSESFERLAQERLLEECLVMRMALALQQHEGPPGVRNHVIRRSGVGDRAFCRGVEALSLVQGVEAVAVDVELDRKDVLHLNDSGLRLRAEAPPDDAEGISATSLSFRLEGGKYVEPKRGALRGCYGKPNHDLIDVSAKQDDRH